MGIQVIAEGNVGADPVVKSVLLDDGSAKQVLSLRVCCDRWFKRSDGSFEPSGSDWVNVHRWLDDEASGHLLSLYQKGQRVQVMGRLRLNEWEDKDEQKRAGLEITASKIAILPSRVEKITMRAKDVADAEEEDRQISFEEDND